MKEGWTLSARLVLLAALLLAGFSARAEPCHVTKTEFGLRTEGDCFAFERFKPQRQPNLVVPRIAVYPNQLSVIPEMEVRNAGSAGTEGLFSFLVRRLDGEYQPVGGQFDVLLRVEARDTLGSTVPIYDDRSGQWHNYLEYRQRAARLGPGDDSSHLMGQFYLPDRDRNYDICVYAVADPNTVAMPGGEIWESAENDNHRVGGVRLYPATGEPDYTSPICANL